MSAMKERPILFSAPMVRALLEGRKTQTRRLLGPSNSLVDGERVSPSTWAKFGLDFANAWVDKGPSPAGNPGPYLHVAARGDGHDDAVRRVYPLYSPGERLWVKETWLQWACPQHDEGQPPGTRCDCDDPKSLRFRADGDIHAVRWKPSIFMPRWASRIDLELTLVRAERLQDISEEDAEAEGVEPVEDGEMYPDGTADLWLSHRDGFRKLWDSINSKRATWASNPWVFVLQFRRVRP